MQYGFCVCIYVVLTYLHSWYRLWNLLLEKEHFCGVDINSWLAFNVSIDLHWHYYDIETIYIWGQGLESFVMSGAFDFNSISFVWNVFLRIKMRRGVDIASSWLRSGKNLERNTETVRTSSSPKWIQRQMNWRTSKSRDFQPSNSFQKTATR